MLNLKNSLFIAALIGFPSVAFAGSDSGVYLGGSMGVTSANIVISDFEGEFDEDDAGYKIFAGYNFGLIPVVDLAIEGSYVDFGSMAYDLESLDESFTIDTTAWDVYGLVGLNAGPVGLFGKVGLASWSNDVQIQSIEDAMEEGSGTDLTYGVGAKVQFMSLSIRAEYEYFDFENVETDMFSVGAAITF